MAKVTIFQYEVYDQLADKPKIARRWGTREAIESEQVGIGRAVEPGIEVDDSIVESDIRGFTADGFIPYKVVGMHKFANGAREFTEPLFYGTKEDCEAWEKRNEGIPGPARDEKPVESYSAVFPFDEILMST